MAGWAHHCLRFMSCLLAPFTLFGVCSAPMLRTPFW